jgi:hypothetical protein
MYAYFKTAAEIFHARMVLADYICRILLGSLCLTAAFAHLWMENCTKKKVWARIVSAKKWLKTGQENSLLTKI